MYVNLVRYSLGRGKSAEAQAFANELGPLIAVQDGCRSIVLFGDHSDGEGGLFVSWDSEANAVAATEVILPVLDRHLGAIVEGPPESRHFEVIWTR